MKKILKILLIIMALGVLAIGSITVYFIHNVYKQYGNLVENYKPFTPSIIYDINGNQIDIINIKNRRPIEIENIPIIVQNAFIAVEDKRFRNHHGIDYLRLAKAVLLNVTGSGKEGGSTITQQLIKNLFLTPERSLKRKLTEAILATELERRYTKEEILENYLNSINFGRRAYGIKNAAKIYFNKEVNDLTVAEASILASIPKSPTKYSKIENAIPRHRIVLKLMYNNGFITKNEYEDALKEEITFYENKYEENDTDSISKTNNAPEFTTEVIKEAMKILKIDDNQLEKLLNGYKIYSTLDINMQKAAYKAFSNNVMLKNNKDLEGALISIDPSNGFVKSMVGGKNYIKGYFNRAISGQRQPGSSFKPFVYLTAIEQNYPPNLVIEDVPYSKDNWKPKNYAGVYKGGLTMVKALEISNNISAIKMLEKVGLENVISNWKKIGVGDYKIPNDLTLALGSITLKPIDLAVAYATLANGGYKVKPQFIYKIENKLGEVIYEATPKQEKIFNELDIAILTKLLQSVVNYGTGRGAKVYKDGKIINMAGKTGTTNDNISVWFTGYTPTLSTVVYLGYDDNRSIGDQITGSSAAIPLWREYMQNVVNINNYEVGTFEFVDKYIKNKMITSRVIDLYNGLLDSDGKNVREVYFKSGNEPVEKESNFINIFTY